MLARSFRRRGRWLRGKPSAHEQPTSLPKVAWSDVFQRQKVCLIETAKRSGNVTLGELAILAQAAAGIPDGSEVIEIGTFDGRTTVNLALSASPSSAIFTLDLPPHQPTRLPLEIGERRYVDKPQSGARFSHGRQSFPGLTERITQLLGTRRRSIGQATMARRAWSLSMAHMRTNTFVSIPQLRCGLRSAMAWCSGMTTVCGME